MNNHQNDRPSLKANTCISHMMQPVTGHASPGKNPGEIQVTCRNMEPKSARLLKGVDRRELLKPENHGREVLVIFADGNPDEPVIIGMFENILDDWVCMEPEKPEPEKPVSVNAVVDGERIVIQAEQEIVLACGKGSITVRNDGRIILKGTEIMSCASRSNKIKGSTVTLN